MSSRRVSYFYNNDIGSFNYGHDHPMKPKRIQMAHELIVSYGLYKDLNVYNSHYATREEMSLFHTLDYLQFIELSSFNGHSSNLYNSEQIQSVINDQKKKLAYKVGESGDCPLFDGLYDFCRIATGGSWDAAVLLGENACDVAINWAGGLHHAKKSEAAGFCYVNDIVVCILVLLQYYERVLYIDIDVHHGDGVEEAFYTTNRVMTLSLHQYEPGFFPGSGDLDSAGEADGKGYSINVPLKRGINDSGYYNLFKNIFDDCYQRYRPSIIVLQCGADSIVNDKLGQFNMSSNVHGDCVDYVLSKGMPTMLLGGGGYTIENVACCWANETAVSLKQELDNNIPLNDRFYDSYNSNKGKIRILAKNNVENKNTEQELNLIQETINNRLKELDFAPSVPFHQPTNIVQQYKLDQQQMTVEQMDDCNYRGKDVIDQDYMGGKNHLQSKRNQL